MAMVNALKAQGWNAEIIFYSDTEKVNIVKESVEKFDAYGIRIDPENISDGDFQGEFFFLV